ncbi:MAG: radical SAM protein [Actinomycetota bacterium]|nr:radical SAM protein [Actinomycetota bacterium]
MAARGRFAYDPCSGQTLSLAAVRASDGVVRLSDAALAQAEPVHPAELEREWPVSVCWSPIVTCNLQCPHCLDDKQVQAQGSEQRRQVARALAAADIMGVDVSGGEPLLLRDLYALLDILREGGLAVSVTTNGWRLAASAGELARHVDAVRVSLDGADARTHDRWRGAGSFERAVAGIDAAARAEIPVQVQMVLMRTTAGSLEGLVSLAADHGARGVSVMQMLPIGEGEAIAAEQALSDGEAERLVSVVTQSAPVPVRLRLRDSAENFTVVRADGRVWRNGSGAARIDRQRPLKDPRDLMVAGEDGSA